MSDRKPIVVVCPGRGTYTKTELGYLDKYRPGISGFLDPIDTRLKALGEPTVSELDGAKTFSFKTHTPGEYASTLIYACSAADFLAIDRSRYEIVAVTGNSMGWYTTLGLAGALREQAAFELIHTMGSMMKGGVIGGQVIYPVVDAEWRADPGRERDVWDAVEKVRQVAGAEVYLSIKFGGYAILGGNEAGLKGLMDALPKVEDRYPFQLVNHAAFHTPLLRETSDRAFLMLGPDLFQPPEIPVIDGRGHIWNPWSTDPQALRDYTLGHQVYAPYDFTKAVTVALKEFQPEALVLLGPGSTSGGALGQVLVGETWQGVDSKAAFAKRQKDDPFVLAMGREDQHALVAKR